MSVKTNDFRQHLTGLPEETSASIIRAPAPVASATVSKPETTPALPPQCSALAGGALLKSLTQQQAEELFAHVRQAVMQDTGWNIPEDTQVLSLNRRGFQQQLNRSIAASVQATFNILCERHGGDQAIKILLGMDSPAKNGTVKPAPSSPLNALAQFIKNDAKRTAEDVHRVLSNYMQPRSVRGVHFVTQPGTVAVVKSNLVNWANKDMACAVMYHESVHQAQLTRYPEFEKSKNQVTADILEAIHFHGAGSPQHLDADDTLNARMCWVEGQAIYLQKQAEQNRYPAAKLTPYPFMWAVKQGVAATGGDKKAAQYEMGKEAYGRVLELGGQQLVEVLFQKPQLVDVLFKTRGNVELTLLPDCDAATREQVEHLVNQLRALNSAKDVTGVTVVDSNVSLHKGVTAEAEVAVETSSKHLTREEFADMFNADSNVNLGPSSLHVSERSPPRLRTMAGTGR